MRPRLSEKQAEMFLSGIKNYGKNIVGGAKIVGSAMKKGVQKLASPLVKELKMQEEADRRNKIKGKALNKAFTKQR